MRTRKLRLIRLGSSNKEKNFHIMKNNLKHIKKVNEICNLNKEKLQLA